MFFTDTPPVALLAALRDLCVVYDREFDRLVKPVLSRVPEKTGMAFGVTSGPLFKTTIFQTVEYLAPALNVAARLQGRAKSLPERFGLICDTQTYDTYLKAATAFRAQRITVNLKGMRNGENSPCVRIDLQPLPGREDAFDFERLDWKTA